MIVAHLYAIGALSDAEDVVSLDVDIPLNKDGLVELDLEVVPIRRGSSASHLTVVEQLELPLNA